ncbi:MAG: hypothetical protein LUE23_00010, partial [Lachnospiraceae bacterium]|nr:hypothetical protein [Lachnospiraceae bacterium]
MAEARKSGFGFTRFFVFYGKFVCFLPERQSGETGRLYFHRRFYSIMEQQSNSFLATEKLGT